MVTSSSATTHPTNPFSSSSRIRNNPSPVPNSSFLFHDHLSNLYTEEMVEASSLPLRRRQSLEQQLQQLLLQQQSCDDDNYQSGVKLPHVSTGSLSPVDGDAVSDRDHWLLRCFCRYEKVVM